MCPICGKATQGYGFLGDELCEGCLNQYAEQQEANCRLCGEPLFKYWALTGPVPGLCSRCRDMRLAA